jgi:hypothetical protein
MWGLCPYLKVERWNESRYSISMSGRLAGLRWGQEAQAQEVPIQRMFFQRPSFFSST